MDRKIQVWLRGEDGQMVGCPGEWVEVAGQRYAVGYAPREILGPRAGQACWLGSIGVALVRTDLPPRVRRFVLSHELYHLRDTASWGGWIGEELRANVACGWRDLIGLFATVWLSLTTTRLKFYWLRLWNPAAIPEGPSVLSIT